MNDENDPYFGKSTERQIADALCGYLGEGVTTASHPFGMNSQSNGNHIVFSIYLSTTQPKNLINTNLDHLNKHLDKFNITLNPHFDNGAHFKEIRIKANDGSIFNIQEDLLDALKTAIETANQNKTNHQTAISNTTPTIPTR